MVAIAMVAIAMRRTLRGSQARLLPPLSWGVPREEPRDELREEGQLEGQLEAAEHVGEHVG